MNYDRDTARAMFEAGDFDVLLDYFDDAGFDRRRLRAELDEIVEATVRPYQQAFDDLLVRHNAAMARVRELRQDIIAQGQTSESGRMFGAAQAEMDWLIQECEDAYSRYQAMVQRSEHYDWIVTSRMAQRCEKALDPGRVRAMLEQEDTGVLLDYLSDDGCDVGTATEALEAVMLEAIEGLEEAMSAAQDEYRVHRNQCLEAGTTIGCYECTVLYDAWRAATSRYDAAYQEWEGRMERVLDLYAARKRREKAFDLDRAVAMCEGKDWQPLKDYLVEELGFGYEAAHEAVSTIQSSMPVTRSDLLDWRPWLERFLRFRCPRCGRGTQLSGPGSHECPHCRYSGRRRVKSFDSGAALRMAEEGDRGPLHDYLMEERGLTKAQTEWCIDAICRTLREGDPRVRHLMVDRCIAFAIHSIDNPWEVTASGYEVARMPTREEAERLAENLRGDVTGLVEVREREKAFDPDTAAAMLEQGDTGPLLDYFDDAGYDETQLQRELWQITGRLVRPVIDVAHRAYMKWDADRSDANHEAWDAAVEEMIRVAKGRDATVAKLLDEWKVRHGVAAEERPETGDKAFDPGAALRMLESRDYGVFRDYLVEERGLSYEAARYVAVWMVMALALGETSPRWRMEREIGEALEREQSGDEWPFTKVYEPDRAVAMVEDAAWGPLHDYLMDEMGLTDRQALCAIHFTRNWLRTCSMPDGGVREILDNEIKYALRMGDGVISHPVFDRALDKSPFVKPLEKRVPVGLMTKSEHKSAVVMIELPEDAAEALRALGAEINTDDLAEDGREEHPHVTVRYGIDADADEARKLLEDVGPFAVTLTGVGVFENPEHDVVKAEVESPELHAVHELLGQLPHEDEHPEYNPHATIAYVQGGHGADTAERMEFGGLEFVVDELVFSDADGEKTHIPLAKRKAYDVETAMAIFERNDLGILLDYFDDEGYTEEQVYDAVHGDCGIIEQLLQPYFHAENIARNAARRLTRDTGAEEAWDAVDAAEEASAAIQYEFGDRANALFRMWNQRHEKSAFVKRVAPEGSSGKLFAFAYVDDRAVHFDGDWDAVVDEVIERGRLEKSIRVKHFDEGRAIAMIRDGAWGPLNDYLVEELGLTEDQAATTVVYMQGWLWGGDSDDLILAHLESTVEWQTRRPHRFRKSFDRGTVRAMLEAGDVGPLCDYFMDAGYGDEMSVLGAVDRARDELMRPHYDATMAALEARTEANDAVTRARQSQSWSPGTYEALIDAEEAHEAVLQARTEAWHSLNRNSAAVMREWRRRHGRQKSANPVQAAIDAVVGIADALDVARPQSVIDVLRGTEVTGDALAAEIRDAELADQEVSDAVHGGDALKFGYAIKRMEEALFEICAHTDNDADIDSFVAECQEAWHRRDEEGGERPQWNKAFDPGRAVALARSGDEYALHDYLMEERGLDEVVARKISGYLCHEFFAAFSDDEVLAHIEQMIEWYPQVPWLADPHDAEYGTAWTVSFIDAYGLYDSRTFETEDEARSFAEKRPGSTMWNSRRPIRRQKAYDRSTVVAMLEENAIGQMLDYFDDAGFDEQRVRSELDAAIDELMAPLNHATDVARHNCNAARFAWLEARNMGALDERAATAYDDAFAAYGEACGDADQTQLGYEQLARQAMAEWMARHKSVQKFVRRHGDKWVVLSHKGRVLGTYDTKKEADHRLQQIEYFKQRGKAWGDWNSVYEDFAPYNAELDRVTGVKNDWIRDAIKAMKRQGANQADAEDEIQEIVVRAIREGLGDDPIVTWAKRIYGAAKRAAARRIETTGYGETEEGTEIDYGEESAKPEARGPWQGAEDATKEAVYRYVMDHPETTWRELYDRFKHSRKRVTLESLAKYIEELRRTMPDFDEFSANIVIGETEAPRQRPQREARPIVERLEEKLARMEGVEPITRSKLMQSLGVGAGQLDAALVELHGLRRIDADLYQRLIGGSYAIRSGASQENKPREAVRQYVAEHPQATWTELADAFRRATIRINQTDLMKYIQELRRSDPGFAPNADVGESRAALREPKRERRPIADRVADKIDRVRSAGQTVTRASLLQSLDLTAAKLQEALRELRGAGRIDDELFQFLTTDHRKSSSGWDGLVQEFAPYNAELDRVSGTKHDWTGQALRAMRGRGAAASDAEDALQEIVVAALSGLGDDPVNRWNQLVYGAARRASEARVRDESGFDIGNEKPKPVASGPWSGEGVDREREAVYHYVMEHPGATWKQIAEVFRHSYVRLKTEDLARYIEELRRTMPDFDEYSSRIDLGERKVQRPYEQRPRARRPVADRVADYVGRLREEGKEATRRILQYNLDLSAGELDAALEELVQRTGDAVYRQLLAASRRRDR